MSEAQEPTEDVIREWTSLAERLGGLGNEILRSANVEVTPKGLADGKILTMALLARTLSHLRAIMLLLHEKRVVEARTIVRCCYENLYWMKGISEEGEAFVRKIVADNKKHMTTQGELMFRLGLEPAPGVFDRLRGHLKALNKDGIDPARLNPKKVASISNVESTYFLYGQLSRDSVHPTLTSLRRYVDQHLQNFFAEPEVHNREIAGTFFHAAIGVVGACMTANETLSNSPGGKELADVINEALRLAKMSKLRESAPD